MRFCIFIIFLSLVCPAFGQDTLYVANNDTITALEADSAEISTEYADLALLRSWRKAYPFKVLTDEAYEKAMADTLLDKSKRPFSYSPVKLAADSLKTLAKMMPFDETVFLGQTDYRMPVFNTGKVPHDSVPTIIDKANDYSAERWDYVAPANASYTMMDEASIVRENATYQYVKGHPSRYTYTRGSMILPPTLDREMVSTEKSLEGKSLAVTEGAKSLGQIEGIQSNIKTDVWHKRGSSNIQMSQTALTDNWYRGGDNNMTVLLYRSLN